MVDDEWKRPLPGNRRSNQGIYISSVLEGQVPASFGPKLGDQMALFWMTHEYEAVDGLAQGMAKIRLAPGGKTQTNLWLINCGRASDRSSFGEYYQRRSHFCRF
jgi:hypothetical protein